jgi:hypothetical protein
MYRVIRRSFARFGFGQLERLISTLWVGSLWTTGYFAAPTLFITLADRTLAGTIAGSLFRTQAWVSLACAALLLLIYSCRQRQAKRDAKLSPDLLLVITMLVCTVIGYFGLQPFMAAIKESAAASSGMTQDARRDFLILHGAASSIYLIQSLLGVFLVINQTATKTNPIRSPAISP